jgi:hypothetical protein
MGEVYGRRLPISQARRLVGDFLYFAQQVPTVPVQRRMNIAPLIAARKLASPRPSWCALFTKAYALVAATRPELRRTYMNYPRPHLYEHPISVASIAVERRLQDEDAVLFTLPICTIASSCRSSASAPSSVPFASAAIRGSFGVSPGGWP